MTGLRRSNPDLSPERPLKALAGPGGPSIWKAPGRLWEVVEAFQTAEIDPFQAQVQESRHSQGAGGPGGASWEPLKTLNPTQWLEVGVIFFKELTLLFVKAWLVRPATGYREALPSLTVSVTTLGRGSSMRAARARMCMVSRALASLGFRI